MILKLLGAILTISSSAAIGFYFSIILKERVEDLKNLKKCIFILRGDIRYSNTPLPEAIGSMAERNQNNFKQFFEKISDELIKLDGKTFSEIWKKSVDEDLKDTCMNKKDKVYLANLGDNLGYLDKEMQINTIDLYIEQLEGELKETIGTVKEKTRLYNLLGVLSGIFITIIML